LTVTGERFVAAALVLVPVAEPIETAAQNDRVSESVSDLKRLSIVLARTLIVPTSPQEAEA
jgi:hypothetical protein